jgi:hypothetical protein
MDTKLGREFADRPVGNWSVSLRRSAWLDRFAARRPGLFVTTAERCIYPRVGADGEKGRA